MTSSGSGNRCSACFEKIILPSATTSNIPLVPSISSVSRPSALLISAARLEALGRYFQRVQYVIDSFIGPTLLAPYTTIGCADSRDPSDPMSRDAVAAALRWVRRVLDGSGIPFQLAGDAAAAAHGAARPVRRLELFIAAEHAPALLRAAAEQVIDPPWRRRDDAWDRVALSLSYGGVVIDVCLVEAARFRETATGEWRDAAIDPAASVVRKVLAVDAPVMPRGQLLDQKRRIDREIDRRDVRDILAAAP